MKRSIIIILLLLAVVVKAQKRTVYVSGKVTDTLTGKPLKGVNIQLTGTFLGTITDYNGVYNFKTRNRTKFSLKYSYVGYEPVIKEFDLGKDSSTVLSIDVSLTLKEQQLPMATIMAERKPEVVYSSYKHNVADFIFLNRGYLFLAYDKFQRYSTKVMLLDRHLQVKVTMYTPVPFSELYTDFEGTHYGVGKKGVFKIKIMSDRILFTEVDQDEFNHYIKKMEDTLVGGNILLSNYEWFYPRFSYYEMNPWNGNAYEVKEIVNEELEHLMRMQYYFLSPSDKTFARKLGAKYGTEKQIAAALMIGFPNSIYYEKLYAPSIVINDTVNIFDHYANYLYKYKPHIGLLDSVKIDYHHSEKDKEWEREILFDEETNKVYAVFEKEGHKFLKRINPDTGQIEGEFKLYYKWIDRIRIKNNEVYYVYRPYESVQKKFLYREMIVMND